MSVEGVCPEVGDECARRGQVVDVVGRDDAVVVIVNDGAALESGARI